MTIGKYTPEEPISSIATALAPAALGIVRVSGKGCIELVSKVFSRPKALLEAPGNTLVYGWIQEENKKIDEVMLAVYRAPKSFTGEDMVEIFCHGGPSVVTAIQNLMLRSGFRQADRGEYTFRAYINGKTDLTKAEAIKEIIDSHTDDSRSHAAGRLAGSLFQEIDSIKKLIIDTLAAIEVEIEYPEDEETIADTFDRDDIVLAISRLQSLVDSWKSEKLYQDGARVVLAGRTNAGKSSLFNAILKEERAIVSNIEGTTRDAIDTVFVANDKTYVVIDTAGIRKRGKVYENIEKYSVLRAKGAIERADVVLIVIDGEKGIIEQDKHVAGLAHEAKKGVIIVYNKWDLVDKDDKTMDKITKEIRDQFAYLDYAPVAFTSAKDGKRVNTLLPLIDEVYNNVNLRIKTNVLNEVIMDAQLANPAKTHNGKRLKIYYASQVETAPCVIALFVNDPELMHFSYQRYIENKVREAFGFEGVPITIVARKKES